MVNCTIHDPQLRPQPLRCSSCLLVHSVLGSVRGRCTNITVGDHDNPPSPPAPPQVGSCVMAVQKHALAVHKAGARRWPMKDQGPTCPRRQPGLLRVRTRGEQHKAWEENWRVSGLQDRRYLSVTKDGDDGDTEITRGLDTNNVAAAPQRHATECATARRGPLDPPHNAMSSLVIVQVTHRAPPPPFSKGLGMGLTPPPTPPTHNEMRKAFLPFIRGPVPGTHGFGDAPRRHPEASLALRSTGGDTEPCSRLLPVGPVGSDGCPAHRRTS